MHMYDCAVDIILPIAMHTGQVLNVESSEYSAVWSLSYPVFCQVHWIETLKKAKENNFRGKHIQSNKFTPLL